MSTYSYLVAWLWYLGAVVGMILVWWHVTRSLPPHWRDLLRALPAAWALTPWSVAVGHQFLAPAWLVTFFEAFLREDGDVMRAGAGLVLATFIALLVVGIEARRRWTRASAAPVTERREPTFS